MPLRASPNVRPTQRPPAMREAGNDGSQRCPPSDRPRNCMKSRRFLIAQLAGATAGLLTACARSEEDKDSGKSNSKESRVKRGANGEIIVRLDDPTQKRIGLILDNPAPAQWQTEVRGYGRVLDPGPLAALVAELDAGRAAAEASRQEYERLKVLVEQTNASLRALQAADAAAKRDRLFVESTYGNMAQCRAKAISKLAYSAASPRSPILGEVAVIRLER